MTYISHRLARSFVRFLDHLANLKQLSLVNQRIVSLEAWNKTPEEQQSQLLHQLGTSYSSGLQMFCSTDVPTEEMLVYTNGPFQAHDITMLEKGVENLKRIISRDSQVVEEDCGIIQNIASGQQLERLQHLDIRKMHHLCAELQSFCLI